MQAIYRCGLLACGPASTLVRRDVLQRSSLRVVPLLAWHSQAVRLRKYKGWNPSSHVCQLSTDVSLSSEKESLPEPRVDKSATTFRLVSGVAVLPHPAKMRQGGEDAYFISKDGLSAGVADGVGGWAELGVDVSRYSRDLMAMCERAVAEGEGNPREVIMRAHSQHRFVGSSTATVAILDSAAKLLRIGNIGDSGFLLIREEKVVAASRKMQHSFNFPFQIGSFGGDSPAKSEVYEVEVEDGDILVLATDGLYDNIFEADIVKLLGLQIKQEANAKEAAGALATLGRAKASLKRGASPFAVEARAAGLFYDGGKMDDITVVVSYVKSSEEDPKQVEEAPRLATKPLHQAESQSVGEGVSQYQNVGEGVNSTVRPEDSA